MFRITTTCAVLAIAGTACADVIISNVNAASTSGTAFGDTCAFTIYKAGGFTMPAGDDYTLDKVLLAIDYAYSGGGQLGRYTIWSGASPTSMLSTLSTTMPQVGQGIYEFTPDTPVTLEAGQTYWVYVEKHPAAPTGCMLWQGDSGGALPTGIATSAGYLFNGNPSAFANRYEVQGTPLSGCYPDCDGSGTLDLFDFLCFVNEFNNGDPYADCDGSGNLDLFDFLCFVNKFNNGCP